MATGKNFVAIAGNIGTGKTSLTQMLATRFGWVPHLEAVGNNPYLEHFYQDMKRWSFPLQVYFLTHRFKSHRMIAEGLHSAVQDRSIYEDAHIFARNLYEQGQMEKREYHNYLDLYQCMSQALQPPDVIVYLKKSLPHLKKGILKRNREYEKNLPDQYLLDLNRYYEDWFEHYSLGKKLVIESDSLDFVNQSEDFDVVCEKILGTLDQGDFLLQSTLKA